MARVARVTLLLLTAALLAVGCGGEDGDRDDGAKTADGIPAFDASRIPNGRAGIIVRLDDARIGAAIDVLRRVSGYRAAEDSLPTRDRVLHAALDAIDIDVPAGARFGGWVGDEAGAARTDDGWIAWVRIRTGETAGATRFIARADGVAARVEQDTLLLASDEAALDAVEDGDDSLADHRRWKQLDDARSRSGALVAATDGDAIAVAGSDDGGLWLDGVGRGEDDSCAGDSDDGLDELERLPVGTTLGAAPAAPTELAALVKDAFVATDPFRPRLPDAGIVTRVVAGVDRAVLVAGDALAAGGSDTGVVGLSGVGGAKPALVAPDDDETGTLAADPGFAATRKLVDADKRIAAAAWVDPLRIVRALGDDQLDGIEGSVVSALGDGIDGAIAWRTCDDRLGARVAITG